MKKLLAVLLALVMLVSLAACAGNTDKDNPSSDAPANSDNPSMKANVNKKIAMIMQQGGLGDQGFNDTAYAGLMTCKEKYDLDVNAVECTDTTQGETLIRELCEAGYGLIINLEAGISGNMYTVARDYPDIYFVVVGRQLRINAVDGFTETPKNVIESYITLNEHSFLAGVVAAFAATDGNTLVEGVGQHEGCNIGILFGAESVGFYQYGDGFRQGALFYNPDAKVYMVNPEVDIATSAKWAQHQGADAVIVTGCSTGTETASSDLEKVKNSISIPVAVGSGVTEKNIAEKMQIADILIVGTTLRRNGSMAEPIDEAQARALLRAAGREV